MKAVLKAFALLVALIAVFSVSVFAWIGSRGVSARAEPGRVERAVARTMRGLAMPGAARELANPVVHSPEVVAEGLAHFADHCAACHANDGSGETDIGLRLYPRPPDMRQSSTQSLTDGELFYIIENGVRLSGMPAWSTGTDKGREATWHLVHFIRELPRLTSAQTKEMETINPKSRGDAHGHEGPVRKVPPSGDGSPAHKH